jgi:hypothetical protein
MQQNEKKMKAAIAISRATVGDVCIKDEAISKLKSDLSEVKLQLISEVNNLFVFSRIFISNHDIAIKDWGVFAALFSKEFFSISCWMICFLSPCQASELLNLFLEKGKVEIDGEVSRAEKRSDTPRIERQSKSL